jgi:hypothetical protein
VSVGLLPGAVGAGLRAAEFKGRASSGDLTQALIRGPLKYFVVFFLHVANKYYAFVCKLTGFYAA